MALAKAQESIQILHSRFIALPLFPHKILGRHPDLHRSRENGARPQCGIAEQDINQQKGRHKAASIAKP
jgi:hypothetical protein